MAGRNNSKSHEDKTKKRKREAQEADAKAKRHRKEEKANGLKTPTKPNKTENGDIVVKVVESTENGESGWKVSKPMGGRMLDIDPILTDDEQYLIITYNTSLQIYSAADSLLLRRIPITTSDKLTTKDSQPATIVATRLSKQNTNFVWVACSDGRIFHADWTQTAESIENFQTKSATAKALTVLQIGTEKKPKEAVLVIESDKSNKLDVTAYLQGSEPKNILSLKKNGSGLQLLESSHDGRVLVGALHDRLFIGTASSSLVETLDQLSYDFFSFDAPDIITTLDLKVVANKKAKSESEKKVDIIVGGARGAIYHYHDALSRIQALGNSKSDKDTIQAQKYHWHRKAVHAVKWSRDGNYMISGGSENVLVIWQIDTSKKDFLPHLSGCVENIVVSSTGSSYVLHLDDNSAMIISTTEMKPSAYISGIQSTAAQVSTPKDALVQRVGAVEQARRSIPAAIRSTEPSKLHLCVGNGRQSSAPLLQSFDLESFTSINKQPLARTQPTDVNITNKGVPIDEPLITHISFSADGKWLASVDEWQPSERDVETVSKDLKEQFIRERHEIYLKFWEMGSGENGAALVSRINAPHATSQPETVLDLAAAPMSTCFATIGSDGMVRLWRPKLRQHQGIVAKGSNGQDTFSWTCSQAVAVGDGLGQDASVDITTAIANPQGAVAFSEDGSTIFAAYGVVDTGVVYVIDAASGEIVKTLENLWAGKLRSIKALSSFVIVLSDELRVYDVVGDELRYGIDMLSNGAEKDLVQLAVDYTSGHFGVVTLTQSSSSIGIFDPEEPEPLLVRALPHRIVSLVSAPTAGGFVALDDAAQVWTITEGSSSLAAIQPLEDLRLGGPVSTPPKSRGVAVLIGEDAEMASDDEGELENVIQEDEDVDMEDDDVYASVVAPQHLAEIFDAAPAFAAPSVEDMFYKVTNLLAGKPLLPASR